MPLRETYYDEPALPLVFQSDCCIITFQNCMIGLTWFLKLAIREILDVMWKYETLKAVLLAFFSGSKTRVIHIFNTFRLWPEILPSCQAVWFLSLEEGWLHPVFSPFPRPPIPLPLIVILGALFLFPNTQSVSCDLHTTKVSEPRVLSYFSQVSEKLGKTQNSKPWSPTPTNFIKRKSDYKLCIHYSITTLHKARQKSSCLISQAMLISQLVL